MAPSFATSLTAFAAACACADAFTTPTIRGPTMSLEKYKAELAETAKKIASPGESSLGQQALSFVWGGSPGVEVRVD
jgi:hypothetical protein